MRLSSPAADLSPEPDGMFVSRESLGAGRARLILGAGDSPVLVERTPDMVLEVVSRGSVHKDMVELRQLYWEAGIPEYWLVDSRAGRLSLVVLRHASRGYVAVRRQGGWVKSAVFGKSFGLTQQTGADGYAEYTLDVR
jgi:Uma2 family endonuclease